MQGQDFGRHTARTHSLGLWKKGLVEKKMQFNQQVSFRTLTSGGFAASRRGTACLAGLWPAWLFCVHLFGLILKGGGVWWWGCMPRHSRNAVEQEAGGEANSPKTQKPQRRQYGFGCRLIV